MAAGSSSHIVSEAEIQAALAEAEAQATSIPSLDDGQNPTVVPVPVETAAPLRPLPREVPAPVRTPPPPPAPPATTAAIDGTEDTPASEDPAEPPWWQRLYSRLADLLYVTVDGVLWALNRPFEKLAAETRQLLGLLALVTVIVSLTAAYLLPRLVPPRDAVSQLTRQSATVQQTVPGTTLSAPN